MNKRPRQPKLTLVISDELRRKARAKAITQGTTLSAVVREFLGLWVVSEIELPSEKRETIESD